MLPPGRIVQRYPALTKNKLKSRPSEFTPVPPYRDILYLHYLSRGPDKRPTPALSKIPHLQILPTANCYQFPSSASSSYHRPPSPLLAASPYRSRTACIRASDRPPGCTSLHSLCSPSIDSNFFPRAKAASGENALYLACSSWLQPLRTIQIIVLFLVPPHLRCWAASIGPLMSLVAGRVQTDGFKDIGSLTSAEAGYPHQQ